MGESSGLPSERVHSQGNRDRRTAGQKATRCRESEVRSAEGGAGERNQGLQRDEPGGQAARQIAAGRGPGESRRPRHDVCVADRGSLHAQASFISSDSHYDYLTGAVLACQPFFSSHRLPLHVPAAPWGRRLGEGHSTTWRPQDLVGEDGNPPTLRFPEQMTKANSCAGNQEHAGRHGPRMLPWGEWATDGGLGSSARLRLPGEQRRLRRRERLDRPRHPFGWRRPCPLDGSSPGGSSPQVRKDLQAHDQHQEKQERNEYLQGLFHRCLSLFCLGSLALAPADRTDHQQQDRQRGPEDEPEPGILGEPPQQPSDPRHVASPRGSLARGPSPSLARLVRISVSA